MIYYSLISPFTQKQNSNKTIFKFFFKIVFSFFFNLKEWQQIFSKELHVVAKAFLKLRFYNLRIKLIFK